MLLLNNLKDVIFMKKHLKILWGSKTKNKQIYNKFGGQHKYWR